MEWRQFFGGHGRKPQTCEHGIDLGNGDLVQCRDLPPNRLAARRIVNRVEGRGHGGMATLDEDDTQQRVAGRPPSVSLAASPVHALLQSTSFLPDYNLAEISAMCFLAVGRRTRVRPYHGHLGSG